MLAFAISVIKRLPVFIVAAIVVTSCRLSPANALSAPWVYTDTRAIDRANDTRPELDLIAAYSREVGDEIQIRVDLLEVDEKEALDLYLFLDTMPGGLQNPHFFQNSKSPWDIMIAIPAIGPIQTQSASEISRAQAVRVIRDPTIDSLEIDLKLNRPFTLATGMPDLGYQFLIISASPGADSPADIIGPSNSDSSSPTQTQVLLAFWNTFPAYSPAQALRRWDGAHTGPLGGRHGLYNLLRTAQASKTPIVLLDLKFPASISALDFLGVLSDIQTMEQNGILILPEYGMPGNSESDYPSSLRKSPLRFQPSEKPIPIELSLQPDLEGLSLEMRRQLVETALSSDQPVSKGSKILLLGGDLPASTWGNPQVARLAFSYLKQHPWIKVLNENDLISLPDGIPGLVTSNNISQIETLTGQIDPIYTAVEKLNKNPITTAAQQAYQSLYAPTFPIPPNLIELRKVYQGQINSVIAAANWAENPSFISDCQVDTDRDGQPECILASPDIFTLYELKGGYLTYAFARLADGFHQFIAPSSQFIIGQSDSDSWNLENGLLADPSVIPGAFGDGSTIQPQQEYLPTFSKDSITLASSSGDTKKFSLSYSGLSLEINSSDVGNSETQIPVALDPWLRFSSHWSDDYSSGQIPQGWFWETKPGFRMELITTSKISVASFKDSLPFLHQPEDPNLDYPPGHFLPFPISLATVQSTNPVRVEIRILSNR